MSQLTRRAVLAGLAVAPLAVGCRDRVQKRNPIPTLEKVAPFNKVETNDLVAVAEVLLPAVTSLPRPAGVVEQLVLDLDPGRMDALRSMLRRLDWACRFEHKVAFAEAERGAKLTLLFGSASPAETEQALLDAPFSELLQTVRYSGFRHYYQQPTSWKTLGFRGPPMRRA